MAETHLEAVLLDRVGGEFPGEAGGGLGFEGLQLLFEFLLVIEQGLQFLLHVVRSGVEARIDGLERGFLVDDEVERGLAGDGFDAARACGDGHFSRDLDEADLARGRHVRAAAEFLGVAADVDQADELAVLVAEEGERVVGLPGIFDLGRDDAGVVDDLLVDQLLDLAELRLGELFEVREIEAQAVRRLVRAELADVRAEDLAQRPVDQVRGGMVAGNRAPAVEVDMEGSGHARRQAESRGLRAESDLVQMATGLVLDGVNDVEFLAGDEHVAGVADLAAHFAVERVVSNTRKVSFSVLTMSVTLP